MFSYKYLIHIPVLAVLFYKIPQNNSIDCSHTPLTGIASFQQQLYQVGAPYVLAFFCTFISIIFLLAKSKSLGLIDHPDRTRKIHYMPKPAIGGLGILAGVTITMLVFAISSFNAGLLISMLLIGAIGAADDRHYINFKIRFLFQALAAVIIMLLSNSMVSSFGNLFGLGHISLGYFAPFVTIFCVIGVINAINMIDGIDGLAGSLSLIAFITFGLLTGLSGRPDFTIITVAFSGALVAFLYFNRHPAKLFMGDAGSMSIGLVLAYLSIETTQHSNAVSPVAALLVLSLPVSDTMIVMLKRILAGKSPFHADKQHIHHVLLQLGFTQKSTVLIMAILSIASSSIAVIGTIQHLPDPLLFAIWLACFTLYFIASYKIKTIHRIICKIRRQPLFKIITKSKPSPAYVGVIPEPQQK